MSTSKSGLVTVLTKGNSYLEDKSLKSFLGGVGKGKEEEFLGYFSENINVTYSELEKYGDKESWVVCYPDSVTGENKVESFVNTEDMELSLIDLVKKTYHERYIRIYNVKDMKKL